MIEWWRTATLGAAAVGQTLFVVFYLTLPWWRGFLGRALFFKAATLCLVLDVGMAGRVWDWPREDAYIAGLYSLVTIGVWAQLAAFVVTERENRDEPTE